MEESLLSLEYPLVEGDLCRDDVLALMEAYSGKNGECTAILQYAYQNYIFDGKYETVAKTLEKISVQEMKHHSLLAKAIIKGGGDPIIAGRFSFFSGAYVSYIKGLKNALKTDIAGEKTAIEIYEKIIEKTHNESLKNLLSRIVMDEEVHIRILQGLLDEC